jgi:hypothetical protein
MQEGEADTSNVDDEFKSEKPKDTPAAPSRLQQKARPARSAARATALV